MTGILEGGDRLVRTRFARESEAGVVADAYLVLGPSRSRLRALAHDCAGVLLGLPSAKVAEHPEFVLFDPEALGVSGLKVEHIAARKENEACLERALRYRPSDSAGGRRVVVLLDADRMGPDAQAALLKTAEEPPAGTVLILSACSLAPLLPALRSRCRVVRMGVRPAGALAAEAEAAGIAEADWRRLVAALGTPEAVLELESGERSALLELAADFEEWLGAGCAGPPAWLRVPEGGSLADRRAETGRTLAAALGWVAAAYGASDDVLLARLDEVAAALADALGDLGKQITPAVLVEDLQRLLGSPA